MVQVINYSEVLTKDSNKIITLQLQGYDVPEKLVYRKSKLSEWERNDPSHTNEIPPNGVVGSIRFMGPTDEAFMDMIQNIEWFSEHERE